MPDRTRLFPKASGEAVDWLKISAMAFSDGDLFKAQRFYEDLIRSRADWLRINRRRLPTEEQLDRQHYAQRRRGYGPVLNMTGGANVEPVQ